MEENTGFNFFPVFNALQNIIFSIEDKQIISGVCFVFNTSTYTMLWEYIFGFPSPEWNLGLSYKPTYN